MFEIQVEGGFSAAHFLKDYNGKCEALHGHNYKVFVSVKKERLNGGGMVMDFGQLKKVLRGVTDLLDHKCLNDIKDFDNNPSAERIARYIYEKVKAQGVEGLFYVDVYETDSSRARYMA